MKKKIIMLLSCILMITSVFAIDTSSRVVPLDRIAAIVNTDVITESQLEHQIAVVKKQFQQANAQLPSNKILRQKVLQQLIDEQLQLQLADTTGIHVSDAELNLGLQRLAQQKKISVNDLYQQVQQIGYTIKEFKQEIRNQIKIEKLQQREVTSHVRINQQEVEDFMLVVGKSVSKEYHLQNILIPLPDAASPEQIAAANKQARNIVRQLKTGMSFRKLAMTKSSGKKSLQGGDLGWRKLAELPVVFANRIQAMKIGGVAGPIRAPNGVHVIKLLGVRRAKGSESVSKNQVEQMIFQRKVNEALQQFINTLHNQVYIKIM